MTSEMLKGGGTPEYQVESYVLEELRKVGVQATHWPLKPVIVAEIEYMLRVLETLIEPDYMPPSWVAADGSRPRYIPSSVRLAVWRRDMGRCVECGSQERLEYDHIIPLAKGGSSTERNIQLLCEACNRAKAAAIA